MKKHDNKLIELKFEEMPIDEVVPMLATKYKQLQNEFNNTDKSATKYENMAQEINDELDAAKTILRIYSGNGIQVGNKRT
uniref:Phage protein n=1 Tax=Rhabditophanes sp. KR3021 TaxID=114890 RepID=A0AC35U855_9BILA